MTRSPLTLVHLMLCVAVVGCTQRDTPAPAVPAASGAAAGATAVAGPASGPSPASTCGTGPDAPVTLSQINVSGSSATIQVNPGSRMITMNATGVRWKLNQNGYAFTGDGIVFKPNQPAGPASAPPTNSPTEFVWCFNPTSTAGTVWNYSIKFAATAASAPVFVCDPTIINASGAIETDTPAAPLTVNCTVQ
jgi:hypothetical protein